MKRVKKAASGDRERDRMESGKLHQARGVFHFTLCNCSCLARFTLVFTRNFVVIFLKYLLNISPRIFACSFSDRTVAVVAIVVLVFSCLPCFTNRLGFEIDRVGSKVLTNFLSC